MEETTFVDIKKLKTDLLENQIVKNVTYNNDEKTFIVTLNEPWDILGLNAEIRSLILGELSNSNDLQSYQQNMVKFKYGSKSSTYNELTAVDLLNDKLNSELIKARSVALGLPTDNLHIWSVFMAGIFQHPTFFDLISLDLIDFDQSIQYDHMITILCGYVGQKSIIINSGFKTLIVDSLQSVNKYNNGLLTVRVAWIPKLYNKGNMEALVGTKIYGRHLYDHFEQPHYHGFPTLLSVEATLLYNLYRTWREMSQVVSGSLITNIKRINFGIQFFNISDVSDYFIKLQSLLIGSGYAIKLQDPFYVAVKYITSIIDRYVYCDDDFKRYKLNKIPVTDDQLNYMLRYGIKPIENRYWKPECFAKYETSQVIREPVKSISVIPKGSRIDFVNDIIISIERGTSSKPDLMIMQIPQMTPYVIMGWEFLDMREKDTGPYDEMKNLKNYQTMDIYNNYNKILNSMHPYKLKNIVKNAIMSELYQRTLPGLILHAYINGIIPNGKLQYDQRSDKVIANYINIKITTDKTNQIVYDPEQFLFTLSIAKDLNELFSERTWGSKLPLKLHNKEKITFINASQKMLNLVNIFPNWSFRYLSETINSYGQVVDGYKIVLNDSSSVIYWTVTPDAYSSKLVAELLSFASTVIDKFVNIIVIGYDPKELFDAINTAMNDETLPIYDRLQFQLGVNPYKAGMFPSITFKFANSTQATRTVEYYGYKNVEEKQLFSDVLQNLINLHFNINHSGDELIYTPGSILEQDLSPGVSFKITGNTVAAEQILGIGQSCSTYGMVTRSKRNNTDKIVYAGTISQQMKEITRRRKAYFLYEEAEELLDGIEYSEIVPSTNMKPMQSLSETITQSGHQMIYNLREIGLYGDIQHPLIDIGSSSFTSIHMTKRMYTMVDLLDIPTYDIPEVKSLTYAFKFPTEEDPRPNEGFIRELTSKSPESDILIYNSLGFISDSRYREDLHLWRDIIAPMFIDSISEYIKAHPNNVCYFNFPYCDAGLAHIFKNPFDITSRRHVVIKPDDPNEPDEVHDDEDKPQENIDENPENNPNDDDPKTEVTLRYIGKFGTHGSVLMFRYQEVVDMLMDLAQIGITGTIFIPTLSEITQQASYHGVTLNTLGGQWLQSLMLLSPVLILWPTEAK